MTLPNFFIVGAARSGTTALHYLLQKHPDIHMSSNKEPHFFAFDEGKLDINCLPDTMTINNLKHRSVVDFDNYKKLFINSNNAQAIGDASPLYLASAGAPLRIKKLLPSVKIIVILRNPIDRAYSHFLQNTRGTRQVLPSFSSLLMDDTISSYAKAKKRYYIGLSLYYQDLKHYFEVFHQENVKVYLFEDFKQNSDTVLQDIFQFLGVDSFPIETEEKYNASGVSKIKAIDSFLLGENPVKTLMKRTFPPFAKAFLSSMQNKARDLNSSVPPRLSPSIRDTIMESHFHADISNLQTLIDKDVSIWLKPSVEDHKLYSMPTVECPEKP